MIRNKYELKAEKKRLRQREKELKGQIVSNWKAIKSTLRPKNLISSHLSEKSIPQNGEDSLLVNIFSYGAAILGRKLGEKAEEKLHDFLKKD